MLFIPMEILVFKLQVVMCDWQWLVVDQEMVNGIGCHLSNPRKLAMYLIFSRKTNLLLLFICLLNG